MKSQIKNIMLSLGALTMSQVVHADSKNNASAPSTPSNMNDQMVITPSASPVVKHGADVFVDADFIYWAVKQEGLPYAYTGYANDVPRNVAGGAPGPNPLAGTNGFTMPQGSERYVDYKMEPGFKVGLGLDMRHDGWDTYLEYTWLQSKATGSTSQGSDDTAVLLTGTLFQAMPDFPDTVTTGFSTVPNYFDTISAQWSLHFNVFDWEIGRNFFVSPRLTLRPHIGLKGTWQKQHFNVQNSGMHTLSNNSSTPVAPTRTDRGYHNVYNQQFYWGVGIRTGMDASWLFTPSWSLYGDWALSALWGQFKAERYDLASIAASGSATFINAQIVNTKREFHTVSAVLELALGLRYDYFFSDDDYRFRIQAGWEEQIWFSQNNVALNRNLPFRDSNFNLVMQGLTVKLRFDF